MQIPSHDRKHIGVHHRRAGALVLLDLRDQLARERHRHVGVAGADEIPDAHLVGAVRVGVDEADGDRIDAGGEKLVDRASRCRLVQRALDLALGIDPLGDLEPQPPRDERRRLLPSDVVECRHPEASDLEHVPEAEGGDEAYPRPFALEDCIRRDRGPVHELGDAVGVDSDAGRKAAHDPPAVVLGRREDLSRRDVALLLEKYEVREGAPDINPDSHTHQAANPMSSAAFRPRICSFSAEVRNEQ